MIDRVRSKELVEKNRCACDSYYTSIFSKDFCKTLKWEGRKRHDTSKIVLDSVVNLARYTYDIETIYTHLYQAFQKTPSVSGELRNRGIERAVSKLARNFRRYQERPTFSGELESASGLVIQLVWKFMGYGQRLTWLHAELLFTLIIFFQLLIFIQKKTMDYIGIIIDRLQ